MKPNRMITTVVLLLAGSTAAWWLSGQKAGTDVAPTPLPVPEVETVITPVEPALPEEESGSVTTDTATANVARRLTHVPDTRPPRDKDTPSTDFRNLTAGNIEQRLHANLDHALSGEMASAFFVIRARRVCERFASTPDELEKRIRRTNRRVEKDIERGRDLPASAENGLPWSTTGDQEDNRAHLQQWYDACQRVQDMFTPDLRRQLELLALDGDVMARYLYASWPLEQLDAGGAFEQQYRWEELARAFSRANLDEGEVAGLMAYAQSYMNGTFTERNGDLALAFSIAALNCGFETTSSRNFLTNRIENLTSSADPGDQQRLQFALAEADRLGEFCK